MVANIKLFIKGLLFIICGIAIFSLFSDILLEKSTYPKYKAYINQPEVDILIFGSSHSNVGINSLDMGKALTEECGREINVFNYSIYGMRIEHINYFFKEALKNSSPKMIIIDTYSFLPIADEHKEILARRAFDALPLSINKIQAINYLIDKDMGRESYYLPFIKYHSRWKELTAKDFSLVFCSLASSMAGTYNQSIDTKVSSEEGFVDDGYFNQDFNEIDDEKTLKVSQEECLNSIIKKADENNIKILFITVPYKEQLGMTSMDNVKINNYIRKKYVDNDNIKIIDFNLLYDELNFGYDDLSNEGHVNKYGAEKTTNKLLEYINLEFLENIEAQ